MLKEMHDKKKNNLIIIAVCSLIVLLVFILRLQTIFSVQNNNETNSKGFDNFTIIIMATDLAIGGFLLLLSNINWNNLSKNRLNDKKAKLLISGDIDTISNDSNAISMNIPTKCKAKTIELKNVISDDCTKIKITFAANQNNEWKIYLKRYGEPKYCAAEGQMKDAQFDFSQKITKVINIPENKSYDSFSIQVLNPENEDIVFNIYDLIAVRS